jgi:hypothetical protein
MQRGFSISIATSFRNLPPLEETSNCTPHKINDLY